MIYFLKNKIIMSDEEPQFEYEVDFGESYDESDGENYRVLLEQKEKDLMLAAELGKALLEKNAELEKKTEQLTEEYGQRVESLEQQKYALHLKLENLEGEYENTVKELQYDINQLKEEVRKTKQDSQYGDREKQHKITELSLQTERLSEEVQQAKEREQIQLAELQQLRVARETSVQANQIEHLQDQISNRMKEQTKLERHIEKLTEEKESFLHVLDEAQDKIKMLERQKQEQDEELRQRTNELHEAHERNAQLTQQVDQLTEKASDTSGHSGHSMTLFNELCQLTGSTELSMATDSPVNIYPPSTFDDEEIECDDDDFIMASSSPIRFEEERLQDQDEQSKMEEEIAHAYRHLRQLCRDIKSQMGDKVDDDTQSCGSEESGSLDGAVTELREAVQVAMDRTNKSQAQHVQELQSLQERLNEMEQDLRLCRGNLHRLQEQIQQRELQLQQKTFRVNELSKQVASQHEDIRLLSAQRDKLQDMMAGDRTKPQMYSAMALLRHARRERDAAVDRRYAIEKELQQSRYEVIVLNHQLMEAVQQKNSVSSLLDQWQSDMADLLGVQMEKNKLGVKPETVAAAARSATSEPAEHV